MSIGRPGTEEIPNQQTSGTREVWLLIVATACAGITGYVADWQTATTIFAAILNFGWRR